jgi:hypothetical protein
LGGILPFNIHDSECGSKYPDLHGQMFQINKKISVIMRRILSIGLKNPQFLKLRSGAIINLFNQSIKKFDNIINFLPVIELMIGCGFDPDVRSDDGNNLLTIILNASGGFIIKNPRNCDNKQLFVDWCRIIGNILENPNIDVMYCPKQKDNIDVNLLLFLITLVVVSDECKHDTKLIYGLFDNLLKHKKFNFADSGQMFMSIIIESMSSKDMRRFVEIDELLCIMLDHPEFQINEIVKNDYEPQWFGSTKTVKLVHVAILIGYYLCFREIEGQPTVENKNTNDAKKTKDPIQCLERIIAKIIGRKDYDFTELIDTVQIYRILDPKCSNNKPQMTIFGIAETFQNSIGFLPPLLIAGCKSRNSINNKPLTEGGITLIEHIVKNESLNWIETVANESADVRKLTKKFGLTELRDGIMTKTERFRYRDRRYQLLETLKNKWIYID